MADAKSPASRSHDRCGPFPDNFPARAGLALRGRGDRRAHGRRPGGKALAIGGHGVGVVVDEARLARLVTDRRTVGVS
jgi:hypothetical protein